MCKGLHGQQMKWTFYLRPPNFDQFQGIKNRFQLRTDQLESELESDNFKLINSSINAQAWTVNSKLTDHREN